MAWGVEVLSTVCFCVVATIVEVAVGYTVITVGVALFSTRTAVTIGVAIVVTTGVILAIGTPENGTVVDVDDGLTGIMLSINRSSSVLGRADCVPRNIGKMNKGPMTNIAHSGITRKAEPNAAQPAKNLRVFSSGLGFDDSLGCMAKCNYARRW